MFRLIPVLIIGVLLAGESPLVAAEPVVAKTPKSTFVAYCASCHGEDGKGLPDLGYKLVDNAFVRATSDADLKEFLMYGRQPGSLDSKMELLMPAFDYLTDEELGQAVAYLRRLNDN